MATCPRCLGPLTDGHRCRPIWIKRLRRQVIAVLFGGFMGAFIQVLIEVEPVHVPAMGFVIGAMFSLVFVEATSH